jgi:hypothetical protein
VCHGLLQGFPEWRLGLHQMWVLTGQCDRVRREASRICIRDWPPPLRFDSSPCAVSRHNRACCAVTGHTRHGT